MKHIIEGFSVLFIMMLNLCMAAGVLNVTAKVAEAKAYKAAAVAEIENSNFNPNVIAACIEDADARGYSMEVTTCSYACDSQRRIAQVCLTYDYELPLIGVSGKSVTRGIAR